MNTNEIRAAVVALTALALAVGCTSTTSHNDDGQGGSAQGGNAQGGNAQGGNAQGGDAQGGNAQGGNAQGGNAQGGSDSCELAESGEQFTFTISNIGSRELRLTYGCGSDLPIAIDTADGLFNIGEEGAEICGWSCENTYAGEPSPSCSDCGPGYGDSLGPGEMVTIAWDRRAWAPHSAPPACTGLAAPSECALPVDASAATSGVLTVCADDPGTGTGGDGYCSTADEETFPFTIDPNETGLLIEVE